jgi:hypothetical protein
LKNWGAVARIETIVGACILLGKIANGDWLTILIALVSLTVLFRWKVSNPVLIAIADRRWVDCLPPFAASLGDGSLSVYPGGLYEKPDAPFTGDHPCGAPHGDSLWIWKWLYQSILQFSPVHFTITFPVICG